MRHALRLACLVPLLALPAPALAQGSPATAAFNEELQDAWDALRPGIVERAKREADAQLNGLEHKAGVVSVQVRRLRSVDLSFDTAPGLTALTPDHLSMRLPRQGSWSLKVKADVRLRLKVGFVRMTIDPTIKLEVRDISLAAAADFDTSDPTRPTIRQVGTPKVEMKVKLRSSQFGYDVLLRLLTPIGNHLARKLLDDALQGMVPTLAGLQGVPGPIPADGAPHLADSGAATPFDEVVANIDAKARRDHLPHGTLLEAVMDTPAHDSWLDAYRNGGTGNPGTVVGYAGGGDSAIWTGHYLASQAFRYHQTGAPAALDNVRHALEGVGRLLDINGGSGLLARMVAPEGTLAGNYIQQRGVDARATLGGQRWIGDQGDHGISRDQYSGVFFGLVLTHDLVNDAQVKAEATRRLRMMLDYLIAKDWVVNEDRPAFDGAARSGFPTYWAGVAYQKLAFLLIGERVAPGAYSAELAKASPLAETVWLATWTSTFGLDHYYKFNLAHVGYYNYFRLETDPTRWQHVHRGWRILERYVGHHRNAHFDLINASIDPSSGPVLHAEVRELLRGFLGRNHRTVAPAVVDLSNVTWQTFTLTGYTTQGGGALSSGTTQLPSEPLDFDQRKYEGAFHWQRTPFEPAQAGSGNPRVEKPGIDVLLPYWMGRHAGAF